MMDKKNMQAGILTFHYADNYGAVLQAMSLKDYLTSLGYEGRVINYVPKYAKRAEKIILTDSFRHFVISIINLPSKLIKRSKFRRFRKRYLNCREKQINEFGSLVKHVNDYDVVAFGSDQIWNPSLTDGIDRAYFGDWKSTHFQNKIAYAASIGVKDLTDTQSEQIRSLAGNLGYIGIREPEVENVIHRESTVVCDPVLLNDANYWSSIFPTKIANNHPYILIYSLSGYPEVYKMAEVIKKRTSLDVIEIRAGYKLSKQINEEKIIKTIGPESFVNLIKDANYVVTDSFHGTAFSLIFGKNVFVIPNKTKGGRMIHLLERVGLEERIIRDQDITNEIDISMYDSEKVAERISIFREQSRAFLKNALYH